MASRVDEYHFAVPFTTEDELRLFVQVAFGVRIPDTPVCPNHTTPWRAFADAYFARSRVAVWKASRGFGGKTFLLALLAAVEAASLGANVNVLGGSGEQSTRVLEHSQTLWKASSAPRDLLSGDVQRETRFRRGNKVRALLASQASVRGPHPQRLRLDEVDEMDVTLLDAALGQPMEAGSGIPVQTVLSSTHQYADGTMTEVLRRAAEKGWPVYEWCYHETQEPHGWLAPAEVEGKRSDVTAAMWQVEYDLQEPSAEARAILPEAVARMFDRSLGEFEGRPAEYIEIEAPAEGAAYATGADWARKRDWTVISTLRIDVHPWRLVAFERTGRRPWPVMVKAFDDRVLRYPGPAAHDGTGIGDVVAGYMQADAEAFLMVGRPRADLLSECIADLEHGAIVGPWIRWAESELRYAAVDDVYGAGHLPDTLASLALARRAAHKPPANLPVVYDEAVRVRIGY